MRKLKAILFISILTAFSLGVIRFSLCANEQETRAEERISKRNPFMPLITPEGRLINLNKEKTSGDLLLEGTVFDKFGRSYAIVNGLVIEVGDKIDGYRVLKIEQEKVTFMKDGETRVVEIKSLDKEEEK